MRALGLVVFLLAVGGCKCHPAAVCGPTTCTAGAACVDGTTLKTTSGACLPDGSCDSSTVTCANSCSGGACIGSDGCAAGSHRCGASCVSDADPATCGGRCVACPGGSAATCVSGTCGLSGGGTCADAGLCFAACGGSSGRPAPLSFTYPAAVANAASIADVTGDGIPDLAVADTQSLYDQVSLWPGLDGGRFGSPTFTGQAATNAGVLLADLTGDGGWALIAVGNRLYTRKGHGDGTFDLIPIESDAGFGARDAHALRIDSDPFADIVVASPDLGTLEVLRGAGDGTFEVKAVLDAGQYPWQLDTADINGDGKLDIVAANGQSNDLTIYYSNGDFTFSAPTTVPLGDSPNDVAAADLDGDHHAELYVATMTGLLRFATPQSAPTVTPGEYFAVTTGDVDGDGKRELISSSLGGLTAGNVHIPVANAAGFGPWLLAADLDGDGADEVITVLGTNVVVFRGSASGLVAPSSVSTPGRASWLLPVDLDGDGHLDLVAALELEDALLVYFNDGAQLSAPLTISLRPGGSRPRHVVAADMNGDGTLDLVTADGNNPGAVTVVLNLGDRTFGPPHTSTGGGTVQQVAVADITSDGKPDVVAACLASQTVDLFIGRGDGTLDAGHAVLGGHAAVSVLAVELTGDGRTDIAAGFDNENGVDVLRNEGDGGLLPIAHVGQGFKPFAIASADFDHDGHADLATSDGLFDTGEASVYFSEGDGGFRAPVTLETDVKPRMLQAVDIDHDGWVDLAIGREDTVMSFFFNARDGGFGAEQRVFLGADPRYLALGDFNGDGRLEAIASTQATDGGTLTFIDGTCWP